MKEITTKFYCDRCGAEFKPYGYSSEITPGFGVVAFKKTYAEVKPSIFKDVDEWEQNAASARCAMVLCKECLDGLALYLMNE